ncbi:histone family protein nucleoid-structuring protein H-NS [Caballeronia fortuita]|uniref:Histone family protein nucleoid-structuring protein H-NS n=1 Tax=Caballeronia fortuita TaxID=1777138 RepID=A0A157ZBQ6_9BURK|nr:H-NS family nucleoid-associated regulatory protein [Caballeronia fortuita]SAK42975.1 histone family protein nucleoid-structuring protein H-NS [Caballeronia fortuita]
MPTLKSIQAKIAKLQAEADAIVKKQSTKVISEIHALMDEHGITLEDLGSHSGKRGRTVSAAGASAKASSSTAKFMDPKSGATWSGHGRAPGWIAGAKNRDKFLIDGNATSSLTTQNKASKNGAKLGNYKRGPQPALYREPKSGATWSGRGKAPGWLAGAKDRRKFLIDGNAATAPAADKSSAKPAGNYVRGPQPAKYRDPKSGSEWSGLGKAPSWLAGAKDRTKFLIDGAASTAADGTKKRALKAVAAKKATAKKTTATSTAKKGAAKKASATSAKTSAGKSATAKKSTSAAKKGPQTGSKKPLAKKVVAKKASRASAEKVADSMPPMPPVPSTSMSEVDAVAST